MKHRQSDSVPVAAAKAGISRATAYRLLKDGKLPSQDAATLPFSYVSRFRIRTMG